MNDKEVIQKAYETSLAAVYSAFAFAYTDALGDKGTEDEMEAQFQKSVAHARHVRERALALLDTKRPGKRPPTPKEA